MRRIKFYLKTIYRLSLKSDKQQDILWKDLKKIIDLLNLNAGFYEKEKYAIVKFYVNDDKRAEFCYCISEGYYVCRVKILSDFSPELTTDIFVLASHFNNLMNLGTVSVNVEYQYVEYFIKSDMVVPLLFNGEIHSQMISHFETSKLIFAGFQRLVQENEAPAIIIADLMKETNEEKNQNE